MCQRAIWLFFLLCSFTVQAQPVTPHQQVEQATEALLKVITQAQHDKQAVGESYYQAIDALISPMIDFPSFTRNVMGSYGTRDYYLSLPNEQARQQFRQDYQRFVEVFKTGLIHTYGKGLLAFSGQKIRVLKPSAEDVQAIENKQPVTVLQEIQSDNKTHTVAYTMRPNQQGQWLLRNVLIDSVNVGQLYRSQFEAAMQKYQQNFSVLVENWLNDAQQAKQQLETKL